MKKLFWDAPSSSKSRWVSFWHLNEIFPVWTFFGLGRSCRVIGSGGEGGVEEAEAWVRVWGGLAGHGRCLVIGSDQLDSPTLPQLDLRASGEIWSWENKRYKCKTEIRQNIKQRLRNASEENGPRTDKWYAIKCEIRCRHHHHPHHDDKASSWPSSTSGWW